MAVSTVACILCGVAQHLPGDGYVNHLVYKHGVMFGSDFLVESSIHRFREKQLPVIRTPAGKPFTSPVEALCQTNDLVCRKCHEAPEVPMEEDQNSSNNDHDNSHDSNPVGSVVTCWQCPLCPMIYKRRYHFDYHIQNSHQLLPDEVSSTWQVSLTREEFDDKQREAATSKVKKEPNEGEDKSPSPWGPNAFSTTYKCKLCKEQFKRDCDLNIHIRLLHKDEPKVQVADALSEISHSKLDGCVYQCNICGNKFNTSTSFMRHVKQIHGLGLKEYNREHGSAEIVSGVFQCKICKKSLKHTRNIITSHMKLVHQISWQEYHDRIDEIPDAENGSSSFDSSVDLFECKLCDSIVKLKRQHLDKAHSMDEEVYEAFLQKGSNGDAKTLVDGAFLCKLCRKLSMDLKKHLKFCHKMMSLEQYDMIPSNEEEKGHANEDALKLKCFFGCEGKFNKEVDLQVHIKLYHSEVSQDVLEKAKMTAFERNKPKSMRLKCKICASNLTGRSSFWTHLTRKHSMKVKQYEDIYGKLDTDIEPFRCNICFHELKYDRVTIEGHLKNLHNMTWQQYKTWDETGDLSTNSPIKLECCKLCNTSIKNLKAHLRHTHGMNMADYDGIDNNVDKIKEDGRNHVDDNKEEFQHHAQSMTKLDVRDKSLKTCVQCDENFPTRRQFIEHCQIVHGMKFKLKSGESLPLPQVKRSSINKLPDPKRMRLNTNDCD